jgi:hypothetical protein
MRAHGGGEAGPGRAALSTREDAEDEEGLREDDDNDEEECG